MGRLQHFWRWPLALKLLFPLAWVLIGLASAFLIVAPFHMLAPVLGRNFGPMAFVPVANGRQIRRARLIGRAVTKAARFAPFRADCLPQAMAAVVLCRGLGVPCSAFLGASVTTPDQPGRLAAHAWVQSGPVPISGGTGNFRTFGVVACFSSLRPGYGSAA